MTLRNARSKNYRFDIHSLAITQYTCSYVVTLSCFSPVLKNNTELQKTLRYFASHFEPHIISTEEYYGSKEKIELNEDRGK